MNPKPAASGLRVSFPQHADEHRPGPILLAVDQQLGEGAALRIAPELSDPVGAVEVGHIRTWSSSARGAGPRASRRARSACSISWKVTAGS
jgi:hypothetical protein